MDAIRSLCDRCVVMNAGAQDRRRPAGDGAGRPGGRARLSRRVPMLEVRNLAVSLRQASGARRRRPRCRPRRDRRHPRRQRRRQDDVAQGDRRPGDAAAPAARIAFDGRDLLALPPHEIVEAGIALVPEGRGIFGELTVRENLELGAYARRARAGGGRRRSSACWRCFRVCGAHAAGRPHDERRRAADGGDRPRADVGAGHPAAGRAVARPVAAHVRRIVRGARRASATPASASCWSSRTPGRA